MKKQLEAIRAQLESILERADAMSDSDNEVTADRYNAVSDALGDAISSIADAIDAFD